MSRAVVVITDKASRAKAVHWATIAPAGTRVEFKESKRTLPQNARMWAMLTDIAQQVPWHGIRLAPDDESLAVTRERDRAADAVQHRLRLERLLGARVPQHDDAVFVERGEQRVIAIRERDHRFAVAQRTDQRVCLCRPQPNDTAIPCRGDHRAIR